MGVKKPCEEVIAEVKEFLSDVGWEEINYYDDTKQIDAIISGKIAEGEVIYHLLIDFVENKVMIETSEEEYEIEYWETIPQLYDCIISLMKHNNIYQGLPPKPKWKKLKLV